MKNLKVALLLFGSLSGAVLLGGHVHSESLPQLASDQEVIVKASGLLEESEALQRIGRTDFYKTDMATARQLKNEIEFVSLPQTYKSMATVNDPLEPQPYLTLLNASSYWDLTTGSDNIVVAVIDSGFALDHEDLVGRWVTNDGEVGSTIVEGPPPNCTSRSLPLDKSCNNFDDDANGYIDDIRGWDFAHDDNDPSAGLDNPNGEYASHGTSVAGMVGATGNNGVGAASLNWAAKILPLQIFPDDGGATTQELAAAIDYAISNGADIINLSLGAEGVDPVVEFLLEEAEVEGVIIIAAAGNCGGADYVAEGCSYQGQTLYPSTNPYVVSVAATDLSNNRAAFSSYGSSVDIAAPGSGAIKTTQYSPSNSSGSYSTSIHGTSFATPVVTGLAAALRAEWPMANPRDIRAVLVDSALKTSEMNGAIYSQYVGFGRIRPTNAVTMAMACAEALHREDINCDKKVSLQDLSLLASQWQLNNGGRTDINQSGKTTLQDLSLLASKWGQ